jgi:hypothetical protein
MAIGIRILSNNLSGLTTNVTFAPQSGGTMIVLGPKYSHLIIFQNMFMEHIIVMCQHTVTLIL